MSALICGSFAFDNIMVFQDRFKNHILPDKIHILNVSFLVPDMRRIPWKKSKRLTSSPCQVRHWYSTRLTASLNSMHKAKSVWRKS